MLIRLGANAATHAAAGMMIGVLGALAACTLVRGASRAMQSGGAPMSPTGDGSAPAGDRTGGPPGPVETPPGCTGEDEQSPDG